MGKLERRKFLVMVGALVAAPSSLAQPDRRVLRIAYLGQVGRSQFTDAFLNQMDALGWREGINVEYVMRFADGDMAKLDQFARELAAQAPSIIFAPLTTAAVTARKYTETIPIIFSFVYDPVDAGLAKSLAHPGGNATGTTTRVEGLWGRRLQLFREAVPSIRRVAVLYDPADREDKLTLSQLQAAGKELAIETRPYHVRRGEEIAASFSGMKGAGIDAAIAGGSSIMGVHRKVIGDAAIAHAIPVLGVTEFHAEGGMLMSYGIDGIAQVRQAARFADKILRGARPADLPVEQPTVFRLTVNRRTAKAIGIAIPRSILLRADRVIE